MVRSPAECRFLLDDECRFLHFHPTLIHAMQKAAFVGRLEEEMGTTDKAGWHRADIVAEIHKRGSSLARLGEANGFANSTLRSSLSIRHPRAHRVIAEFIGISVVVLWPQFYGAGSSSRSAGTKPATRAAAPSSQKHSAA